ncbi:hypothetical protein DPMN_070504 [Dreissena polymorpha]|uniref:CRAL-TRIO domain-containing protein n=2 Tax=Dreissena polymorpha TaxID=45954 RepID=A0A9D4BV56_DREPO|nr:hypothetical protein DPMN_070504 [Dreissena polymorpha]
MRQVGFDKDGRPVLYMCFAQCSTTEQTVDGAVQHVIALLENAAKSSDQESCGYVWVLDLQGFKFFSSQKIAVAIEKVVSKHYPELLEALLVVNPGLFFHTVWHAMRRFIDQNTRSKIHLYRDKPRLQEKFHNLFPCELREWLFNEINLNLNSQYPKAQKTFWKYNHGDMHDPRGCASYVQKYVDNITLADYEDSFDRTFHLPHKNVLDEVLLRGKFKACGMKYH